MKRRFIAILLVAVFSLLTPALVASADVLIEPNNSFYYEHASECEYLGRSYYANDPSGEIRLTEAPGSKSEVTRVKNGEIIYIMYTYDDSGKLWGVTEIGSSETSYSEWPNGWVQMDKLLLVYDYISFDEEHSGEFYDYTGSYDALTSVSDIVLWSWPGSGETQGTIDLSDEDSFSVQQAYKDKDGREWGFIGYWQGYRNLWICLSDPGNDSIPAFNPPPTPELLKADPAQQDTDEDIPATGDKSPDITLIVILVVILAACTTVLIWVYGKRRLKR